MVCIVEHCPDSLPGCGMSLILCNTIYIYNIIYAQCIQTFQEIVGTQNGWAFGFV